MLLGVFEDQLNVSLAASYVSLISTNPTAMTVTPDGIIKGLNVGFGTLVATRDNATAATAFMVGTSDLILPISTDVFPDAVSLSADGGTRQIKLYTDTSDLSSNVAAAVNGTQYWVSNSDVVEVTPDGNIIAKAPGEAIVTVIYKMSEQLIPVKVMVPQANGAAVAAGEGAVVRSPDGYQVAIAPGSLVQDATVTIQSVALDQLGVPLPPASMGWTPAAAFNLDLQGTAVTVPMQLAIPTALAAGTKVLFYKLTTLPNPDGSGGTIKVWMETESGLVDANGVARTTSPPQPGVAEDGLYLVAGMDTGILADVGGKVTLAGAGRDGGLVAVVTSIAGAFIGAIVNFLAGFDITLPVGAGSLTVLAIRPDGGLDKADFNVEVRPHVFNSFNPTIYTKLPDNTHNPVVTSAQVLFSNRFITDEYSDPNPGQKVTGIEPILQLKGLNFIPEVTGHPPDHGVNGGTTDQRDHIWVLFGAGGTGQELALALKNNPTNKAVIELSGGSIAVRAIYVGDDEVDVRIPISVAVGSVPIRVVQISHDFDTTDPNAPNNKTTGLGKGDRFDIIAKSTTEAFTLRITGESTFVVIANAPFGEGDNRKFIDQLGVITTVDGLPQLTGRIPLGELNNEGVPISSATLGATNVVITGDNARAYVSLKNGGGIALVDLVTLRQVDVDTKKAGDNIITLLPGAMPSAMVLDRTNNYLLVGDFNSGTIYVINVKPPTAGSDPAASKYNQLIHTYNLSSLGGGIRGMALTPDGKQLVVTRSNNVTGSVDIYNMIDMNASPPEDWKALKLAQKFENIGGTLKEPIGLKVMNGPGGDSYIVFTDKRNDTVGVGILRKDGNTWKVYNNIKFNMPVDGPNDRDDSFEVNDAYDVVITPDFNFAFVYSYNRYLFGDPTRDPTINPEYPAGSSVAIIHKPFQIGTTVNAATRMIPLAWGQAIHLSPDGKTLYASYSGTRAVFAFDVDELEKEFVKNETTDPTLMARIGLDDLKNGNALVLLNGGRTGINKLIDLRADYAGYRSGDDEIFSPTTPNSPNRPIAVGGQARGFASQNVFLQLKEPVGSIDPTQPEFVWEFGGKVQDSKLFISTFAPGEGLFPDDTSQEIQDQIRKLGFRFEADPDDNRNRILAREFDAPVSGQQVRFKLPADLALTPGQTYYWGVEVTRDGRVYRQTASFTVEPVKATEGFPAVVLLTHGLIGPFQNAESTDIKLLAEAIARRNDGAAFMYNPGYGDPSTPGQLWVPLTSILTPQQALAEHRALILVSDWSQDSRITDTGFSEAAADALFAALASLDSQVSNHLFSSPIQLIGEGARRLGQQRNCATHPDLQAE